jgi:tetratricopeptide (TPR) repeat protein
MFDSLKPYAKKGKEIGEGLDHIAAGALLLFPTNPQAAVTVAVVSHAIAKTLRGVSQLILGLSSENAVTQNYLAEPERLRTIRSLIVHQAYLEEISHELLRHPTEEQLNGLSQVAFSFITEGPPSSSISSCRSLVDMIHSEELFDSYSKQLEELVSELGKSNSSIAFDTAGVDQRAREKAIAAIDASTELSQEFTNNTLRDISAKLETLGQEFLNTKKNESSIAIEQDNKTLIEKIINSKFADFEAKQQNVNSQISDIHQIISTTSLIDASELSITKTLTQKLKNLFDNARKELQEGSLRAAESGFNMVIELSEGLEGQDILQLRARSKSNLGIVLHINGDSNGAIEAFNLAYEIYTANPNVAALKGFALHLNGKTDEAIAHLQAILANDSESEVAVIILAQILEAKDSPEAAIDILKKHPVHNEGWYDTYGRILCSSGDFPQAVKILDEGLSKFENSVALKTGKAAAISIPLTSGQLFKIGYRSPDELSKLREAATLFKEASSILRNRDRKREFIDLIINYATILLALEKSDLALTVLNEAELIDNSDTRLINLLIAANWMGNHFVEAKKFAERYFTEEQTPEAACKLIAILISSGQPEEALALINSLDSKGCVYKNNSFIQSEKLDALRRSHDREGADKFAVELAYRFPNDAYTLSAIGKFYHNRKDLIKAEEFLTNAVEKSLNSDEKNYFRSQLGEFFYHQRNWKKTLEYLYCDFAALEHCPHVREVAHSYLELGDIETSANIVRAIPREASPPDLLEIRSWIEHHLFEFEECRDTLKFLSRKVPCVVWSLKLADASNRIGKRDIAYGILRDLFDQNPEDIEVAVMVSQACYMMDLKSEAFAFARNIYSKAPHDQRVKALISRALLFEADEVMLTDEDTLIIQNCLVDNDSLESIPMRSDDNGQIDVTPILDRIQDTDIANRDLIRKYHECSAPLSILLSSVCSDIWTAWKAMAYSDCGAIYMATGSATEQNAQILNAAKSREVVVDFSSILTLWSLGKLELLLKKYDKIYISSDMVSNFQRSLDLINSLKNSTGIISHQNGRFYFVERKAGESDFDFEALFSILKFLKDEKIKASGLSPRILNLWNNSPVLSQVPEVMFLPIGVSLSLNIPIYTDQAYSGDVATSLGSAGSFCTQAFLRSCLLDKSITEDDYEYSMIQLIKMNYSFISVSKSTLIKALQIDGGSVGEHTRRVLIRCSSLQSKHKSTANILGDAAATIWIGSGGKAIDRDRVLQEFADAAGVYEPKSPFLIHFIAGIASACLSIPSTIYGMIEILTRRELIDESSRLVLIQIKKRIGSSVLRGMNSCTQMWFPMYNEWSKQNRLQHLISPIDILNLSKSAVSPINPPTPAAPEKRKSKKNRNRN